MQETYFSLPENRNLIFNRLWQISQNCYFCKSKLEKGDAYIVWKDGTNKKNVITETILVCGKCFNKG